MAVFSLAPSDPVVTRVGRYHLQVEWPDPPRATYQVAHEALAEMIDMINELADQLEQAAR